MRGALFGFRLNASNSDHICLWTASRECVGDTTSEELLASSSGPGMDILVTERGQDWIFRTRPPRNATGNVASTGALIAPMPGKVTAVDVTPGATVTKGQRILTLEAMKMEHALVAPFDGTVAELTVEAGAQVQVDALLARIIPAVPAEAPPGA